ncbi:hypothetical protein NX029_26140 [Cytobacillus firmus]|nr:hypothetical protein [Cytobacillus firmus]
MSLVNAVVTVEVGGEQKEKFIVNMPNIRNLHGFLKGAWDLSVYDGCFPKRNRLGDVDGSIEQNGHTLHIEFKESKWSMNQGQVLKAIRQAKYSAITTVFVFGKTNVPKEYLMFTPEDLQPDFKECDADTLKDVFKDWVRYTEANNLVENKTAEWDLTDKYFGR